MSVINKMLKELDERQQEHQLENIDLTTKQVSSTSSTYQGLPWILLTIVTLLLIGVVSYLWYTSSNAIDKSNINATQQHKIVSVANSTIQSSSENREKAVKEAAPIAVENVSQLKKNSQGKFNNPTSETTQLEVKTASQNIDETSTNLTKTQQVKVKPAAVVASNPQVTRQQDIAITEVKLTPEQLANKQFVYGQQAQTGGLINEAVHYYQTALTYWTQHHDARKQLAALLYGQRRLTDAIATLEQGALLYPDKQEFQLLLARVYQDAGEYQQALSWLNSIDNSSVLALQKWQQQSQIATEIKDYRLMEQAYRQLSQLEPSVGRWWMGLAHALDSQQNYPAAAKTYRFALKQQGLSAQAIDYIDQRLAQLGDF